MKRPGAVLASAPTEEDSLRGGTVFCGFRHGTPPGGYRSTKLMFLKRLGLDFVRFLCIRQIPRQQTHISEANRRHRLRLDSTPHPSP
jgi:hypothetical protein